MDQLQLGVARRVITPEVGGQLYGYRPDLFSKCVNDDLTATAFYFRQEGRQALMMSLTLCLMKTELSARIRALLEERLGIPRGQILLSVTHTHSGPNVCGTTGWGEIDRPYCDGILISRILEAAQEAVEKARPVQMGMAVGESRVGINRREWREDRIRLGQEPKGPFDPKMTVLSFVDTAGTPVANLIHYGCHGTAAGGNQEITRDWSGLMTDALEYKTGAVTAFFNGPEGDVGPRLSNGETTGDLTYVWELGAQAARDAMQIYQTIERYETVDLGVENGILSVPLDQRIDRREAAALLEKFRGETVNRRGMIREYAENVLRAYEAGTAEQPALELQQTVIGLGNVVFASTPFELFSTIGMRIDEGTPHKKVLTLSNANGSEGYFVTPDALPEGGYEVDMFLYGHLQPYHPTAEEELIRQTLQRIQKLD